MTWEWLSTWWKYFGREKKLLVLFALENNEIIGIAPLMRSKLYGIPGISKIEFIGTPDSDYNVFILLKKKRECIKLFFKECLTNSKFNLIDLKDVPVDTDSVEILQEIFNLPYHIDITKQNVCPHIVLPLTYDAFLQKLSGGWRRNLRRWLRKVQDSFDVEFHPYYDLYSPREGMDVFFKLHQKRWRTQGKHSLFEKEVKRKFHHEIAEKFSRNGWLGLYFLTLDKTAVAAVYGFEYREKMFSYLTSFDPDYASFSIGHLLNMYVIEHSIKNGYREFDFLRGGEKYKTFWGTQNRENVNIHASRFPGFLKIYKMVTLIKI